MANSDTLDLSSLRLTDEYPMAEVQAAKPRPADPVNHPEAAAAARKRIAEMPDFGPIVSTSGIPTTPTVDLITDRNVLADQAKAQPTVTGRKIPSAVKPMLTAVGIFALVLLMFKAPIIISQINYTLHPAPVASDVVTPATAAIPADPTITIPKINVHAPVVYEPSVVEANVQKALESGVVHYGNTPAPGQAGNVAIFGHSSNDWWEPGNYKFVFVLLDKLAPGDQITLDYQSKRYTYEVTSSKVVEATDVGVLAATPDPTLTLITCTPPGTSLRRLVVTAKQVDPNPNTSVVAAAPSTTDQAASLTSSPSIFDQVSKAWDGVTHGIKSLFGTDSTVTPTGELPASK